MIVVAVIGLQADPRDPDPKETYALIFGVVGLFVVLMFLFQTLDLRRAVRADAAHRGGPRRDREPGDARRAATCSPRWP